MIDFHERLAELSDRVRALPDAETARALLRLAADVDAYLDEHRDRRNQQDGAFMEKWNEFMNERIRDTQRHHESRLPLMRREIARKVAASPHWQGGYADALKLVEEDNAD